MCIKTAPYLLFLKIATLALNLVLFDALVLMLLKKFIQIAQAPLAGAVPDFFFYNLYNSMSTKYDTNLSQIVPKKCIIYTTAE